MEPGKTFISWRKKLEKEMEPKLADVHHKWASRIGHGKMLIPSPLLADEVVKKIPEGELVTVNNIRNYLADKYRADMTCPLTTGIFLNIAAHTTE